MPDPQSAETRPPTESLRTQPGISASNYRRKSPKLEMTAVNPMQETSRREQPCQSMPSIKAEPIQEQTLVGSEPTSSASCPIPPSYSLSKSAKGRSMPTSSNTAAADDAAVAEPSNSIHTSPKSTFMTPHQNLAEPKQLPQPIPNPPPSPATPRKSKGGRKAANPHLTEEQRRQERVLKNRESAMKSLQKKKRYTQNLENRAVALSNRNAELRDKIRLLLLRLNHLNDTQPQTQAFAPSPQQPVLPACASPTQPAHHSFTPTTVAMTAEAAAAAASVTARVGPQTCGDMPPPLSTPLPASVAMTSPLGMLETGPSSEMMDNEWRTALAHFEEPPPILDPNGTISDYASQSCGMPGSPNASIESPSASISTIECTAVANPVSRF